MNVVSSGRRPVFRMPRAAQLAGLIALLIALIGTPLAASAQQITSTSPPSNWSPPRTVYITQTGQTIDGVFLDFWRANNGIANYGYPVTPEFTKVDGHVAQYYQYARYEYWPEAEDGQVVRLGDIGEDLRPKSLQRNSVASNGETDVKSGTSANAEVAQMTRAWLPLEKDSRKKNSDTYVYVKESKHSISNGFKTWWDMTGGTSYLGNPLTQEYILKGTTYQVFERGQLAWEKDKGVWLVPLGEVLAQQHQISTAPVAQGNVPAYSEELFVAPKQQKKGNGERWIEVNLTTQYLIAWEGDVSIAETYVSTGRPGFDTPPGTYHILVKLESQTMEGVIGGEYYNVPDVPWVQYFTNYGHALHGTYWHNNFGATMSHGCVNLPMDFAEWLYGWTSIGTRVEIHF
jgi:lipoprotein-anchoring transpeptidase ErfK/SrfK